MPSGDGAAFEEAWSIQLGIENYDDVYDDDNDEDFIDNANDNNDDVIGKVMEPLLKKLGPSSWECVDSKLAWSRLPRMMIVMVVIVVMMVVMVVVVLVLTANSHEAGCQG